MKIKKIDITNYKTIRKISVAFFNDITLIVGKNNIGKSNVLKSIEIFFNYLEKGQSQDLKPEDFKINSTQINLSITFCDIDKFVNNLKNELIQEAEKKRSNKEKIKQSEILFRTFELLKNKYHELEVSLTIARNNLKEFKFDIINYSNGSKKQKYDDALTKRHYAEKHLFEVLKTKQTTLKDWYDYKWLKITTKDESNQVITYDDIALEVPIDKINELNDNTVDKNALEYIKSTQKFFYVPAYRGGKNEREDAINKLFEIIIEDLVVSKKGLTSEFDMVTDAIWGTGKNSNRYNLQSVIGKRIKDLTNELKNDSISSIQEIEFRPYSKEDVRRNILKTMLGTSSIFLNDGINTSFESKGTGIQSSFMITLMKALSKIEFEQNVNIILVIEEPEAFAHPQLIREIIDKISKEFSKGLFQFIITTHSPVIVNFVNTNKVQRLKLKNSSSETLNVTNKNSHKLTSEDWNLINRVGDVNLSEIVFSDLVIFVEGEGDKIVFEKLLRIVLPNFYSKISIISLSGNNQIFKLLKLLEYYDINWMMLFDKDSFVIRGDTDRDLSTENDLTAFFQQYQIGSEFQTNFRQVINNPNVSKIKITSQSNTAIKFGGTLSKIDEVYKKDDVNDLRTSLFGIISRKMNLDTFPEEDAKEISNELNNKLFENGIPYYCLFSELEGMVINENTKEITEEIFKKYFEESYNSFKQQNKNANPHEYMRALKKAFGSKTHNIEKISASAQDRKKPHIPIEIISNYIDKLELAKNENLPTFLKSVFHDLNLLTEIILKKLESEK